MNKTTVHPTTMLARLCVMMMAWIVTTTSQSSFFSSAFTIAPPSTIISKNSPRTLFSTNPDKPELPPIPGDYDWDAKFAGDPDWMTGPSVPGKKVLNEIDLARQVTALGQLEETWRRERIATEYQDSANVGWVPTAELTNGRFAMFFLITGLLTELWTGVSLPGQVEELLRLVGVIGM